MKKMAVVVAVWAAVWGYALFRQQQQMMASNAEGLANLMGERQPA